MVVTSEKPPGNEPASRFALVGVFVASTANGARVAVTGGWSQRIPRGGDGAGSILQLVG